MNSEQSDYLFVYGSLRRAASPMHDMLAQSCHYVGEGLLQGRLYEVNWYPGAVESAYSEDKVVGEVYQIVDSGILVRLDEYEACSDNFSQPHEYIRKRCWIQRPNSQAIKAWVYVFNHSLDGCRRIFSGDYLRQDG
jgi:gamma-glutamylcyclotransferase (GGCT)/AIG2-like uncharacterized protein YtfP